SSGAGGPRSTAAAAAGVVPPVPPPRVGDEPLAASVPDVRAEALQVVVLSTLSAAWRTPFQSSALPPTRVSDAVIVRCPSLDDRTATRARRAGPCGVSVAPP